MVEAVKKGRNVGDVSAHKRKVRCTQIGGLERKEHSEGHLTHHDEDVDRDEEGRGNTVWEKGRRRG
jgi:hypothetical protein